MPLASQNIPVRLGPIDTKTAPHLGVPGKVVGLTNVWQDRAGEFRKRYGTLQRARTANSGTLSDSRLLARYRDELLLFSGVNSGHTLFSWGGTTANQWVNRGRGPACTADSRTVAGNITYLPQADGCFVSSHYVCAWVNADLGAVRYSVIDTTTGAAIVSDGEVIASATVTMVKVVAVGTSVAIIVWKDGANIRAKRINVALTPLSLGSTTTLATNANTLDVFDVAAHAVNSELLLAYLTSGSTINVSAWTDGLAALRNATHNQTVNRAMAFLHHDYADGNLYLGVAGDNTGTYPVPGVSVYTITSSSMALATNTSVDSSATSVNSITGYRGQGSQDGGTTSRVYYDVDNATRSNIRIDTRNTSGSSITTLRRSVGLAGKVFKFGTTYALGAIYDNGLSGTSIQYNQATAFVLNDRGEVIARLASGMAGGLGRLGFAIQRCWLPAIASISSTQFIFPLVRKTRILAGNTRFVYHAIDRVTLDFADAKQCSWPLTGETLTMTGACPLSYDGVSVTELGFNLWPEQPTLAQSTGGSLTSTGTYSYVIVYEWTDARGQLHRSAASFAKSITLTGTNQTVTLTIPTLRVTAKTKVRIAVYRTENGGTTYFRISGDTLENSTTTDTVSYTDTAADTAITAGELLYTSGDVLDNLGAPASKFGVMYRNRLVLGGCEQSHVGWVSKEVLPTEGAAFNDASSFRLETAPDDGDWTGLAVLDDKLIVFTERAIYATSGEGPNDLGQGPLPALQRVAGGTGCDTPRSVVATPDGVMFLGVRGFWILTRGMQVEYIGADVEAKMTSPVVAAVVVRDKCQVRFSAGGGSVFVYDWLFKQWYVWNNLSGSVHAIDDDGTWCYVASDGYLYRESVTVFADNGTFFSTSIELGFMSLAGIAGFQRVYALHLLGDVQATHTLDVVLYYDYDGSTIVETITASPSAGKLWLEAKPKRQKCSAVKILIRDNSIGEGFRLQGLALEVGLKKGLGRNAANMTPT